MEFRWTSFQMTTCMPLSVSFLCVIVMVVGVVFAYISVVVFVLVVYISVFYFYK